MRAENVIDDILLIRVNKVDVLTSSSCAAGAGWNYTKKKYRVRLKLGLLGSAHVEVTKDNEFYW